MEYVELFQNLAFPVAVCCILFAIVIYFAKKIILAVTNLIEQYNQERQNYIEYLQKSNAELATTIKDNTEAFKHFSQLLQKIVVQHNIDNE